MVSAVLKLGKRQTEVLHVLSCYAPTFASSRADKDAFYDDLQQAILSIPSNDCYVILGDFNARVGSRTDRHDRWWYERGPHGYGSLNEAGRELLSFLSVNEATVCNTSFMKKDIFKRTWQHPKSGQWHCIDHAIMRKNDRRRCLDATVVRSAQCNTDHMMLKVKVRMRCKAFRSARTVRPSSKFDVFKLKGTCTDEAGRQTTKGKFACCAAANLKENWDQNGSIEDKWKAMKEALMGAANATLDVDKRYHPDWYKETVPELKPILEERNRFFETWLNSGQDRDRQKFCRAHRNSRRAMRTAKNEWFVKKAQEAERGRNGGKLVWRCIRDLQHGRRGLVPTRSATIRDEEGNSCYTPEDQQQRWRRHFTKILNITSEFSLEELEKVKQRPVRSELDEPPTEEELENAVEKLKNGKAAGESCVVAEMLKAVCYEEEFMKCLLELAGDVWKESQVPSDWQNAILIPIPNKGDLSLCDNWRGIALLDVVGKLVARVLQERLQKLAEDVLPESQCGFRAGRSCTDMTFTIRQLVEKSWEHKGKVFFSFIDLKKAYDSVPREGLWTALRKLGVPDRTINLINSFHEGMKARVRVDGKLTDEIDVRNGLRQGCCIAPVLFNLYICTVFERWNEKVSDVDGIGVKINYKYDEKIFRRYTRNAQSRTLTECQFADDAALLATSRAGAVEGTEAYNQTCADFGLKVSAQKTKLMVSGRETAEDDEEPIDMGEEEIGAVKEFPYLGSVVAASGRIDSDIDNRIAKASKAFGALRRAVFLDKNLTLRTKQKIYQACVLSVLLYGAECWILLRKHKRKLNSAHHRCIRIILGISNRQQWSSHISMAEIRMRWGDLESATDKVQKRRLEWLGHLARMESARIPKSILFGWLPQPRPRCGPRKRWRDEIRTDLKEIKVPECDWYKTATTSRSAWKTAYKQGVANLVEAQLAS